MLLHDAECIRAFVVVFGIIRGCRFDGNAVHDKTSTKQACRIFIASCHVLRAARTCTEIHEHASRSVCQRARARCVLCINQWRRGDETRRAIRMESLKPIPAGVYWPHAAKKGMPSMTSDNIYGKGTVGQSTGRIQ